MDPVERIHPGGGVTRRPIVDWPLAAVARAWGRTWRAEARRAAIEQAALDRAERAVEERD